MEYGTCGLKAFEDPPRKHHDESVVHRFIDMVTDHNHMSPCFGVRFYVLSSSFQVNTIVHYAPHS
jgi:hypothetical protein